MITAAYNGQCGARSRRERAANAFPPIEHMRGWGPHVAVTQETLDRSDVVAGLQEMRGNECHRYVRRTRLDAATASRSETPTANPTCARRAVASVVGETDDVSKSRLRLPLSTGK